MVQRAESLATSLTRFHPRGPQDRKELTFTSFSDPPTHIPPHINQAINSRLLKKTSNDVFFFNF